MKWPWQPWEGKNGFTLLELLVSIAVLTMLMLIMVKITDTALHTWTSSDEKLKTFLTARAVLDTVSQDWENLVWEKGLPNSGTNVEMSFFTRRTGMSGTNLRPLSLVRYFTTTNGVLDRAEYAYAWADKAGFSTADEPAPTQTNDICEGVLSFQVAFSGSDGSFSSANYQSTNNLPPEALRISMAVVGPRALQRLREMNKLSDTQAALDDKAKTQSDSCLAGWNDWLASSTLPPDVRAKIRFFERVYFTKTSSQ